MSTQYPAGMLLDATGVPFAAQIPQAFTAPSALPGANYTAPTTIIVEPGGGRITLTESDNAERSISYADIYASQPAVGAVVNKLYRTIATLPLKVYQWPVGDRSVNGKPAHPEEVHDPANTLVALLNNPAPGYGAVSLKEWLALPYFVHGNSLVAKYRGNGALEAPTEIIPLDWRFIQAWARIGQPVLVWGTIQTGLLKWIAPRETIYTAWTSPAGSNGAWLEEEIGCDVIVVEQRPGTMCAAAEAFMEALRAGTLEHTGDVALKRHALNAVSQMAPDGRARFMRPSNARNASGQERRVIDALIAATMVHYAVASGMSPAPQPFIEVL